MGGPFSHEELVERHGNHYNVIPSFGLEQGVNERNEPKFRRIDDHSAGFTNLAAHRKQKIAMSMVDYLAVMIKGLYHKTRSKLVIGTEDMRGAYRQIPLVDSQTAISITAIYNPKLGKAQLYEMYGQPFGAGHSVPNFYRVAEWASRTIGRGFRMMLDHFFDDYYYVERPGSGKVGMFCLQQAFKLLGFELDEDKSQPPSEVTHVLGVAFNTQALIEERILRVEPKPLRVRKLCSHRGRHLASEPSAFQRGRQPAGQIRVSLQYPLRETGEILHRRFTREAGCPGKSRWHHPHPSIVPAIDEACGDRSPTSLLPPTKPWPAGHSLYRRIGCPRSRPKVRFGRSPHYTIPLLFSRILFMPCSPGACFTMASPRESYDTFGDIGRTCCATHLVRKAG